MIICVLAPALPHLRPALRLAGPARPVIGLQGRRAARTAARGRHAAPHQSLCVPRISSTAVTSRIALPAAPAVMITGHVPAVRLPPDHADDLMAAAVPA